MSNLHALTKTNRKLLCLLAKKTGKKVYIDFDHFVIFCSQEGYFGAIEVPQIKQILVAFSEELGDRKGYRKDVAEFYYQKWCCGFPKSEFELNPESVISELNQELENLFKN